MKSQKVSYPLKSDRVRVFSGPYVRCRSLELKVIRLMECGKHGRCTQWISSLLHASLDCPFSPWIIQKYLQVRPHSPGFLDTSMNACYYHRTPSLYKSHAPATAVSWNSNSTILFIPPEFKSSLK